VPQPPADVVVREIAEWIRGHTPEPADYAVLAPWTWGHVLEWVAGRPTVATNFGTFVGEDAFRDPARFFLTEIPREGEALLELRRARYVLVTTDTSTLSPEDTWICSRIGIERSVPASSSTGAWPNPAPKRARSTSSASCMSLRSEILAISYARSPCPWG
jgi:hypothetical protein